MLCSILPSLRGYVLWICENCSLALKVGLIKKFLKVKPVFKSVGQKDVCFVPDGGFFPSYHSVFPGKRIVFLSFWYFIFFSWLWLQLIRMLSSICKNWKPTFLYSFRLHACVWYWLNAILPFFVDKLKFFLGSGILEPLYYHSITVKL